MNRRAFLAAAGLAGLSGCAGLGTPSSDTETVTPADVPTVDQAESEPSPTETEDSGPGLRSASIVDLQTEDLTYALTPSRYRSADAARITMEFTRTATADHPATLSVILSNENDFANTFRLRETPPFDLATSRIPHPFGQPYANTGHTYRSELVLAPTAHHELVDDPPAVERAKDGTWRLARGVSPWLPKQVRLEPGETVQGEYVVVGRHDGADVGRPTGVYEFRGYDETLRLAVWNTDAPGPDGPSQFAGTAAPALDGDPSTAWYHNSGPGASSYLEPSTERGSLPEQIRFTMVNKSREALQCGHWNLYKLVDEEWFHIGPHIHTSDCRVLRPGETKIWTLNAYDGEALPPRDYGDHGMNVGFLGGGTYGVVAGYGEPADQSAALVELVGEPVSVVPTEDVTSEHSQNQVTVTSQADSENAGSDADDDPTDTADDSDRSDDATTKLVLTRAESAAGRLIPEQVMRDRNRALRNTLAFVDDDVERVVLRTNERVADRALGYGDDVHSFMFQGEAYELRVETDSA